MNWMRWPALLLWISLLTGCALFSSNAGEGAPNAELRLQDLQQQLHREHDQTMAVYEAHDARYLELELEERLNQELREKLSQMRSMYLEMQDRFGAVLEFHNETMRHRTALSPASDASALDRAMDDHQHHRYVDLLREHHEHFVELHTEMAHLNRQIQREDFAREHEKLAGHHQDLSRLCAEKMKLLVDDFEVDPDDEEMLDPIEPTPDEDDAPDRTRLI